MTEEKYKLSSFDLRPAEARRRLPSPRRPGPPCRGRRPSARPSLRQKNTVLSHTHTHTHTSSMCRSAFRGLTLRRDGALKEALGHGEQRPVGVQRVDGRRRLQQLSVGVDFGNLGHDTASGETTRERAAARGSRLTVSFSGSKVSFRASASSSSPWVAAVR